MSASTIQPIAGPHVWRGVEMANKRDWIYPVPDAVLRELDRAAKAADKAGFTKDSFDFESVELPSLGDYLGPVRQALGEGYGFATLRGIPVQDYSQNQLSLMLMMMGQHLGIISSQGEGRKLIGEVMNVAEPGRKEYYYHVGGPLPMHMDPVDVAGLLCVRKAKSGGESRIVSSMMVHNEILRTRPELLEILYRGYYNLRRNDSGRPLTDHYCPLFADIGGQTVCSYLPSPIVIAIQDGLMTLDDTEREALDYLDEVAARKELILEMDLEPGDVQLLNNRYILHNRADYEDWPEIERRRLLLRVWVTIPGWIKYPANIPHFDAEIMTRAA